MRSGHEIRRGQEDKVGRVFLKRVGRADAFIVSLMLVCPTLDAYA